MLLSIVTVILLYFWGCVIHISINQLIYNKTFSFFKWWLCTLSILHHIFQNWCWCATFLNYELILINILRVAILFNIWEISKLFIFWGAFYKRTLAAFWISSYVYGHTLTLILDIFCEEQPTSCVIYEHRDLNYHYRLSNILI